MKHIYVSVLACALLTAQVPNTTAAPIVDNSQLPGSVSVTWTSGDVDSGGSSYLLNISNGDASKSAVVVISRFTLFAKAADLSNVDQQVEWSYGVSPSEPSYVSGVPVTPIYPVLNHPPIAGFASYSLVITDVDGAPGTWTAKLTFSDPVPQALTARQMVEAALQSVINLAVGVTDKDDLKELNDASKKLMLALSATLWNADGSLSADGGKKALEAIKQAAHELEELLKDKDSTLSDAGVQDTLNRLIQVDQVVAAAAIALATNPQSIAAANAELAKGYQALAAGKINEAFEHYRNAWAKATQP